MIGVLRRKEIRTWTCTYTEGRLQGRDGEDGRLKARERIQKKPTLLTLGFQASNFQNFEKINFVVVLVCSSLLW